jgi:hypothetical protein
MYLFVESSFKCESHDLTFDYIVEIFLSEYGQKVAESLVALPTCKVFCA